MSDIAFAIFASVVLYLAVTHRGFRKVVVWAGAACLLCVFAGGSYLWHRSRAEAAAKQAALAAKRTSLAADDAVQNARIARTNAYDARNKENATSLFNAENAANLRMKRICDAVGAGEECHDAFQREDTAYDVWMGSVGMGNATIKTDIPITLYSCDSIGSTNRVVTFASGETRATVLRFGYEWGTDGNYGAKIQLANGLTGCILDGNTLKLDRE